MGICAHPITDAGAKDTGRCPLVFTHQGIFRDRIDLPDLVNNKKKKVFFI